MGRVGHNVHVGCMRRRPIGRTVRMVYSACTERMVCGHMRHKVQMGRAVRMAHALMGAWELPQWASRKIFRVTKFHTVTMAVAPIFTMR